MVLTLALERVEFLPLGRVTDDTSILTLRSLVFELFAPLAGTGGSNPACWPPGHEEEDGRAWQFALRPGATFHDGQPCTAEDVAEVISAHLRGVDMFGMPWPYARYLSVRASPPKGGDAVDLHHRPSAPTCRRSWPSSPHARRAMAPRHRQRTTPC